MRSAWRVHHPSRLVLCWLSLLVWVATAACQPPARPGARIATLDELPEVPQPPSLEASDRNVRQGFSVRFAALEAAVERARTGAPSFAEPDPERTDDGAEPASPSDGWRLREVAAAYGELGGFALAYGMDETAGVAFVNATVLEPSNAKWWYLSALAHAEMGSPEAAETDLERALDLDPLNPEVRMVWAEQRFENDRLRGVRSLIEPVIEQDPEHAEALLLMGRLVAREGELGAAADWLRRALDAAPQATDVRYALSQVLRDLGETDEAQELIAGVTVGSGGPVAREPRPWWDRVRAMRRGVQDLQRAGQAAFQAGRLEQALGFFTEAALLSPDNPSPQLNRLLILVEMGRLEAAQAQRERLARTVPENRQLLFLSGRIEALRGDAEAAMRNFRAAVAADPTYTGPRLSIARAAFRSGDVEEGRSQFEAVLSLEPGNDWVRAQWMLAETAYGDAARGCLLLPDPEGDRMTEQVAVSAVRTMVVAPGGCGREPTFVLRLARQLYEREASVINAESVALASFHAGRRPQAVRQQSQIVEQLTARVRAVSGRAREEAATDLERAQRRLVGYERGEIAGPAWTEDEMRALGLAEGRPPVARDQTEGDEAASDEEADLDGD